MLGMVCFCEFISDAPR